MTRPTLGRTTASPWTLGAGVAGFAVLAVLVLPAHGWARWVVALALAAAMAWCCWWSPRVGVLVVLGWLFVLGGARRVVSWQLVDVAKDPLLLVGPAGMAALGVRSILAGALRRWTLLAGLVAAFCGVCLVWTLHPDQESLMAGLAGLLFWLVPMGWFWVGRGLLDDRLLGRILVLVAAAGVVSAIYGLVKAGIGIPPWDEQWIRDRGYVALYVGGHEAARPFGLAASAVEFGLIVALGTFVVALFAVAAFRRGDHRLLVIEGTALVLCVVALVVSGVRTAVATLVIASVCSVLVRLRPRLPVLLGLAVLAAVAYGALWAIPAERWTLDGTTGSARRIVVGLRNPFDREDSTLLGHVDLARFGIEEGWRDPLGDGPGATNLAGERFSERALDTEFDVSNGAVAFGVVGTVLTTAILVVGFGVAFVSAWRRPDLRHLAVLGTLILCFQFWWNGGHYFLSAVMWSGLGWLDAAWRSPSVRAIAPGTSGARVE